MKILAILIAGLLLLVNAYAAQDFSCMQDCFTQGYPRAHCTAICDSGAASSGGMLDQPGLPRNPAFDQIQPAAPRPQRLPKVVDHKCINDCQKQGYDYMLCQKRCSYSGYRYD